MFRGQGCRNAPFDVHWTRECVYRISFIDEIWAIRGAYTDSYGIVLQNGINCYEPLNIMHKYSKALLRVRR